MGIRNVRTMLAAAVAAWLAVPAAAQMTLEDAAKAMGEAIKAQAQESKTAPEFTLDGIDGKKVSLSRYRGKVVLLDFWATWCPPCQRSTPWLVENHEKYKDKGFAVVGVNARESKEEVGAYAKDHGIPYAIGLDVDGAVLTSYKVAGFPTFVLVDAKGQVLWRGVGFNPAVMELKVKEALGIK